MKIPNFLVTYALKQIFGTQVGTMIANATNIADALKQAAQPYADSAVEQAKLELVGAVNEAIDASKTVPDIAKAELKIEIDGPILAWRVKL